MTIRVADPYGEEVTAVRRFEVDRRSGGGEPV